MIDESRVLLYVDDETTNLELFDFYMRKRFRVFTAESGPAGLAVLDRENTINIVLSDMRMPVMSGLEFIKKAKEQHPDLHFFILTGYDITPEISEAIESGLVKKYFGKPYSLKEIETAIRELGMNTFV